MDKIQLCLLFEGNAEEAAKFYTSTFKNSKIGKIARYGKSGSEISGEEVGSVLSIEYEIEGIKIIGVNGGPETEYTPAISFFVSCKTEKEVDDLWKKLKGGRVLFELQKYPWAEKYGWCEDKFGVSWQIMLGDSPQKITPSFLFTGKLYGKGAEAIKFYQSVFKDSKVESMNKDPKDDHIMHSVFNLLGSRFVMMEGDHSKKGHELTMAVSFMINCKTQDEIDYYWDNLIKGGGEPSQCGWLKDKFGVWWQVTPTILGEVMGGSDPKKAENVFKEMLKMKKLDIAKLKAAYK